VNLNWVRCIGIGVGIGVLVLSLGCASTPANPPVLQPTIWPTPTSSQVSSPFGMRGNKLHKGLDIAVPKKSPVVATAPGWVTYEGRDWDGYGKYLKIDHGNGYETLYAHLNAKEVKEGQYVARGQLIGRVGKTGNATGYHLHYEVRINGRPVNPTAYLPESLYARSR